MVSLSSSPPEACFGSFRFFRATNEIGTGTLTSYFCRHLRSITRSGIVLKGVCTKHFGRCSQVTSKRCMFSQIVHRIACFLIGIWGWISLCWGEGLPGNPLRNIPSLLPLDASCLLPWVIKIKKCLQTSQSVPWGWNHSGLRSSARGPYN